jgi:23S rRNA maturation-related 3'-5' exoribonuclease YhaM
MVNQEEKEQVKSILLDHDGADNKITAREIDDELGLDSVGSFPNTRAAIRELLFEDQIPVIGTTQGYYVAESEEQVDEYIESLEGRIMEITERKFAITRAADNWEPELPESDSDLL